MTQSTQFDVAADAAESPFVELLQHSGCARLLDAFLANEGFWLTEADLEDLATVDQSTVNRNINVFEEIGLVESRGSHPVKFRFNEGHHAADALLEAHLQLQRHVSELAAATSTDEVNSPFYLLVQTSGRVRILDAILANESFWLTESDLEDLANVDQSTVNRHIDTLEAIGLVISQGSYPTEYQLSASHPATEALLEAHLQLQRDLSTLTNHWQIPVPTAESTREAIQTSLIEQELSFDENPASETTDTTEKETLSEIAQQFDHLEIDWTQTLADSAENLESGDQTSAEEIEYHESPVTNKLGAAEQIRTATPQQPA